MTTEPGPSATDLERYFRLPRVSGLVLSRDGGQLVTSVSELDADGGRYVSSLWSVDRTGKGPARRLTRSTEGETSPAFGSDGSLLFVSERPGPGATGDGPGTGAGEARKAGLWRLPPGGGEPWTVATHPGGITGVVTAADAPVVVFSARVAHDRADGEADASWRAQRAARKITAILHEDLPVRRWDHEVGPEETHLFVGALPDADHQPAELADVRDLTPDAGTALVDAAPRLTADGTAVVTAWEVALGRGRLRSDIVRIDVASGARTVLASHPDGTWSYAAPAVCPVDDRVVCIGASRASIDEPAEVAVLLLGDPGDEPRRLDVGDLWPAELAWTADGRAVLVTGDLGGHHPVHRVDLDTGTRTALTATAAWSSPTPAPDGAVYLLRSGIERPARPVRMEREGTPASVLPLDAPGAFEAPGHVEEVTAAGVDGAPVRAWLALPEGASAGDPAPLLLWVHGGPLGSWNDWSWRWNPWLMTARGWAVLLPDPALSTGYGLDFVRRGWGQWGGAPFTDLMAVTDAATARADVDASRTAAMGGSYGGYMANWIAGHTDRFAAIVSHASIWSLDQFRATTDFPVEWADEMGRPADRPEFYRRWSPDTYVDAIRTPMLVIHGNNDYRCPVSETVRLWTDLVERGVEARYLSFPDENHWILRPGDAAVWYETVFAFLDHHVLGRPWARPDLL